MTLWRDHGQRAGNHLAEEASSPSIEGADGELVRRDIGRFPEGTKPPRVASDEGQCWAAS